MIQPQKKQIQILSDIHLEFWSEIEDIRYLPAPLSNLPVAAPILALLGDIGIPKYPLYKNFIADVSKKFELVLIIAGNHEYYNGQIEEIDQLIHQIAGEFTNVRYLQRTRFVYQDLVFLGATLWTEIPTTPETYNLYWRMVNDYKKISILDLETGYKRGLEPKDSTAIHHKDREWISTELSNPANAGKRVVVFTHHSPTGINSKVPHMREPDHPLKYLDFTDLRPLILTHTGKLAVWGFGHTHHSSSQVLGKTQIVCNCLGYIRTGESSESFSASFVVDPYLETPVETYRGHYETAPSESSCNIGF